MTSEEKQFKKELKELLEKYDATLEFYVGEGSDTHGLYDEEIVAWLGDHTRISLIDGYSVDSVDL